MHTEKPVNKWLLSLLLVLVAALSTAPIIDQRAKVLAAISISVPTIRVNKATLQTTLKNHLTETALKISRKIGYQDFQLY